MFLGNETREKSGFVSYVSISLCFDFDPIHNPAKCDKQNVFEPLSRRRLTLQTRTVKPGVIRLFSNKTPKSIFTSQRAKSSLKQYVRFVPRMMSRLILFIVSLGATFFCTSRRGKSIFIDRAACALPCDDPQAPFCDRPRRAGIRRLIGREEKQSSAN